MLERLQILPRAVDQEWIFLIRLVEEAAQIVGRRRQIAQLALGRRRVDQQLRAGKQRIGGAEVGERALQVAALEQRVALPEQHARLLLLRRVLLRERRRRQQQHQGERAHHRSCTGAASWTFSGRDGLTCGGFGCSRSMCSSKVRLCVDGTLIAIGA